MLTNFVQFKFTLTAAMVLDFVGCYVIENICKFLFADLEPKPLVTRGSERRLQRRQEEARLKMEKELEEARLALERKAQ
jgi:cation-transporting ATPase 13A1